LFNPLTGKNPVKTWLADELFPYLHRFYREAEKITGVKFFYPMNVYRPFVSIQEQNEWMGKSSDTRYTDYIEDVLLNSFSPGVNDPFGGLFLKQCGYIHTQTYLDAVRDYILAKGFFKNEYFEPDEVISGDDFVEYRGCRASAIIFCQGERSLDHRIFKKVPIKPLKGETLTIKTDWQKQVILNRGVYMVPDHTPGEFRVGATYKFNDRSPNVSEMGREELEQKLRHLIQARFEVIQQDWGIRPTTNDRRPLLGSYQDSEKFIIFNGLGTKGVSLAPYFSEVLIRWLEKSGSLNKEVILTRYK
jgi:glycine/D-amino acid oxidase-like deaminating enzyme